MLHKKSLILILVLLMLVLPLILMAQETTTTTTKSKAIEEMSLEDLLNTEVVTATKTKSRISESPAIMSVITADDIKKSGANNLYEILSTIPGVEVIETYYGYSSVTFRGVLQTHYNNKSILFLNGHPLEELTVGSYYLETIPLNTIKRIEIIRGPGSALYGANAYAGVINIITKTASDINGVSLLGKAGLFKDHANKGAGYSEISFGKQINDDIQVSCFGSYNYANPFDYDISADEFGKSGRINYVDNYGNLYANILIKDFTFNAYYFNNKKSKYGIIPTIASTGDRDLSGYGADVKYNLEISENIKVILKIWADYYHKEEIIGNYLPLPPETVKSITGGASDGDEMKQDYAGDKEGIEIEFDYIQEKYSVIAGLYYQYAHSGPYWFNYNEDSDIYDYKKGDHDSTAMTKAEEGGWGSTAFDSDKYTYDMASYLQFAATPLDWLNFVAGLRYNYNKDYKETFAPRGGLVFTLIKNLYLKTLYGMAFRNPSFFEKYVNTYNVLQGNPDLKPEKIQTVDIGLEYIMAKSSFRVNYFYNDTDDLITRCLTTTNYGHSKETPMYGNSKGQKIQGVEMEIKTYPTEKLMAFVNGSYHTGINKEDKKDIPYLTKLLGNIGINYQVIDTLSIGTTVQGVGERVWKDTENSIDIRIAPYALWHLNMRFAPTENMALSLIVRNVLDAKYRFPEYVRNKIESIPSATPFAPQRTIYLQYEYKFGL